MKCFNQVRWKMLSDELKVAVACRFCAIPYFDNLVVQTGMDKKRVHSALNRLDDMGYLGDTWFKLGSSWVLKYHIIENNPNIEFLNILIEELQVPNLPQTIYSHPSARMMSEETR